MINKIGTNNLIDANTVQVSKSVPKKMSLSQKAVILSTSAIGAGAVVAGLAKHKGFSLNPVRIAKTSVKDWALFKYKKGTNALVYEEPQIIGIAAGSVAGGYIGGAIVDKDNIKAKKREVLNQILGNVLVPVGCVGLGSRLFEKYSANIVKMMPKIASDTKFAKIFNMVSTNIPNAVATLVALGIGIFAGNRVSNLINEKLYNKKVDRNIKATDFAPHVDDVCLAASLMNKESEFGSKLGKVIPFALLVPGYQTGIAKED